VQTIHVLSEARILIALCRVIAAFKGELPTDAHDGNGASVRAIPVSNAKSEKFSSLFAIDGSDSALIELRTSICRMVPRVWLVLYRAAVTSSWARVLSKKGTDQEGCLRHWAVVCLLAMLVPCSALAQAPGPGLSPGLRANVIAPTPPLGPSVDWNKVPSQNRVF